MSNDMRTLELFAEANPVPNELAMEAGDIEPAAYLATLQTRSSGVTQLDERRAQQNKKSNGWLIGLAAAALILVIGVVAVVHNQGTEETPPATDPDPVTTLAEPNNESITGYWAGGRHKLYLDGQGFWLFMDEELSDAGTYELRVREADNRVIVMSSSGEGQCEAASTTVLNYDFVPEGLQLSVATDACGPRPIDLMLLNPTDPFDVSGSADSWESLPLFRFGVDELARVVAFEPAFATVVPRGWSVDSWGSDAGFRFRQQASEVGVPSLGIDVLRLVDHTVESTIAFISNDAVFDSSSAEPVEISGAAGFKVTYTPLVPAIINESIREASYNFVAGEQQVMYVVNVGGNTVAFLAHTSNGLPEVETLESILETIIWRDLQN